MTKFTSAKVQELFCPRYFILVPTVQRRGQIVLIQMRQLIMSCLIWIYTVCGFSYPIFSLCYPFQFESTPKENQARDHMFDSVVF